MGVAWEEMHLVRAGGEVEASGGDEPCLVVRGVLAAQAVADGDRAVAAGAHGSVGLAAARTVAGEGEEGADVREAAHQVAVLGAEARRCRRRRASDGVADSR